jgi:hypothetical protein
VTNVDRSGGILEDGVMDEYTPRGEVAALITRVG